MQRILFITNFFETSKRMITVDNSYLYPLGVLSIATRLEEMGHQVRVIDLNVDGAAPADIVTTLQGFKPQLVCLTAYTENIRTVMKLAKTLKLANPSCQTLIGGPHATLRPLDCIKSRYVDFVSLSEGENSILELVTAIESGGSVIAVEQIRNLVFRRGQEIHFTESAEFMKNLDLGPVIKRQYVSPSAAKSLNLTTSRGCPGHCIYCSASSLSGARYRVRDFENVFLECVYFGVLFADEPKEMYIVDDTFTAMKKRVNRFIDLVEFYEIPLVWSCESRIDVMDERLLERMAANGCRDIQYGIESGSQNVLDAIRKHINLESAREIIDLTVQNGMIATLSFMLGHFCDTLETLASTRDFIAEMYELYGDYANMAVSYNTPFPGTWQYENRDQIGLRLIDDRYEKMTLTNPIVETNAFSPQDLRRFYGECLPYTAEGKMIRMEK